MRGWPRLGQLYRWSEDTIKWVAFRLSMLGVLLVLALALGGVGRLVAPAVGETSEAGSWTGVTTALLLYLLGILRLFTVGRGSRLREWFERHS